MGQKGPSILLQSKLGKFPWPIAQQALKSVTEPARAQCWEAELPPPTPPNCAVPLIKHKRRGCQTEPLWEDQRPPRMGSDFCSPSIPTLGTIFHCLGGLGLSLGCWVIAEGQ